MRDALAPDRGERNRLAGRLSSLLGDTGPPEEEPDLGTTVTETAASRVVEGVDLAEVAPERSPGRSPSLDRGSR